MSVRRFDRGELRQPKKMPNGWLRVDAFISRTGVQAYRNADGSIRRELRLPEEVFSQDSLDSFAQVPVTDEHPDVFLDSTNSTPFTKGAVGDSVFKDGNFVRASLMVHDAGLVGEMENRKKVEVSCGYVCDLDPTPGVYQGQPYDVVQRNIRGNHVAIVPRGRAGPEVRVRLDSTDAIQDEFLPSPEVSTVKVTVAGKEFEVPEELGTVLTAEFQGRKDAADAVQASLDSSKAEVETLKARVDSLSAELKAAQDSVTAAAETARASMRAEMELHSKAREVLGAETKFDGMDAKAVKIAVIQKLTPSFKADGLSDTYVDARFDIELEKRADSAGAQALGQVRAAVVSASHQDSNNSADAARARMIQEGREAWKKPLAASK